MRTLLFATALLFASTTAWAQAEESGVEVRIQVIDSAGAPIPTAVVRHPEEVERHRVNTADGIYKASVLYMPNGDELFFEKGLTLEFEVSAPGYKNFHLTYVVKKRKNTFEVSLEKMALDLDSEEDEMDDPVIQFGRDKPID